nr:hypothetical protein [Tanacetum cinerariifolium]
INPEGAEYFYALRLNFANSNNDAEYEGLPAASSGRIPCSIYSWIGVIQILVVSSTIALTSVVSTNRSLSSSISTPFVNPLHCANASLLRVDNTFGNPSTHAPPSWCNLVLIPCIMLRFARSTAPFAFE